MEKGSIIWLNGTSSSGKTTIGKLVQKLAVNHFFYISHDIVNEMNDGKRLNLNFTAFESENAIILAYMAKMISDLGYCVIADSVFLNNPEIQSQDVIYKTAEILKDSPAFLIKVECPADELGIRERRRGDRHIGQAIAQLNDLVPQQDSEYDYVLHNYGKPAEDHALELLNRLPLLNSRAFSHIRKTNLKL